MKPDNNRFEPDAHKYFSLILNIYDDYPFSVYAYRLLGHICRRCGQGGSCFETTRNMAKHIGVSPGIIVRAKAELVFAGAIEIRKVPGEHGEFSYDNITLKDKWKVNINYGELSEEEKKEQINAWKVILEEKNFGTGRKKGVKK
jgi:DNA-binding transcriptional regulator YhcF (GntR family)